MTTMDSNGSRDGQQLLGRDKTMAGSHITIFHPTFVTDAHLSTCSSLAQLPHRWAQPYELDARTRWAAPSAYLKSALQTYCDHLHPIFAAQRHQRHFPFPFPAGIIPGLCQTTRHRVRPPNQIHQVHVVSSCSASTSTEHNASRSSSPTGLTHIPPLLTSPNSNSKPNL
jgi:hypothetical protein